jgi:hypothetical protein
MAFEMMLSDQHVRAREVNGPYVDPQHLLFSKFLHLGFWRSDKINAKRE